MALTSKAKRRLTLLLVLMIAVGGAMVGLYQYQQQRRAELAEQYRTAGLGAFAEGDYATTLQQLSHYHRVAGGDGQTLYAYAQARLHIPVEDRSHRVEAMHVLQRAIAQPDAPSEAEHELLELYTELGNNNNAIDLAQSLLNENDEDVAAWRAKAVALTRLTEHQQALEAAERALELAPDHWQMRLLTFQLYDALDTPFQRLVKTAEELVEQNPEDPRYEMLLGYAHSLGNDRESTARWLRAAAEREPPDREFTETLVRFLDGTDMHVDSRFVLARHVDRESPEPLYREMAQRLFEGEHHDELIRRLEHVDPTSESISNTDATLAGLRAMALYRTGRRAEAEAVVDALAGQQNRPLAEAWSSVLRAVHGDASGRGGGAGPVLQATEQALATFPEHPVFLAMRASAYEEVGETELALSVWRRVGELRPAWGVPRTRQARLLLRLGEATSAIPHAEAGLMRLPQSMEAAAVLAQARAASLDPNDASQVNILLALLERIREHELGDAVLPLHVAVLARTGQPHAAAEQVRRALERADDRPLARSTVQTLADLSRRHGLDVTEQIHAHLERREDVTAPAAVIERALEQARAGDVDQGLGLIEQEIDRVGEDDPEQRRRWVVARAEYLVNVGDPRAAEAWMELAQSDPENPSFQQLALRAGAAERDADFARRALERLRSVLGEDSLIWRVERARWLLEGPADQRDPAGAAELLEAVVSRTPDRLEPRLLLAQAHQQRGLQPLAIRELRAIAERRPESAAIALQLAQLHQSMHQFRSAREQLVRVIRSDQASPADLRRAAAMLAEQGEDRLALDVLEPMYAPSATVQGSLLSTADKVRLAQLYYRVGRSQEAGEVIAELLDDPDSLTVEAVGLAANFHAAGGEVDRGLRILDLLEKVDGAEADKALMRAEFMFRHDRREQAREQYRRAVDTAPDRPELWQFLAAFHLTAGEAGEAVKVAEQADRHLPETDAILAALRDHEQFIGSLPSHDPLLAMLGGLVRAGREAPEALAEAVTLVCDSRAGGMPQSALASRFESLADQHPQILALQSVSARLHLAANRPESASQIALRAMNSFPRAAEPAWLAAQSLSEAGQWREARRAAEQWRQRAGGGTLAADMMIAQAQMELGQAQEALSAIEPYLDRARAEPEAYAPVLLRYALGLVAANRAGEAEVLLEPLLQDSAEWRGRWLELAAAAVPDQATAQRWLEQAGSYINEQSFDERLVLARSWSQVAERFEAPSLWDRALTILDELTEIAPDQAGASLWLQHAIVADQAGDLEIAEGSYRRSLERDPNMHVARNNLAMVLLNREPREPGAVEEALEHSRRVVAAVSDNPYFLDTLAQAQAAAGECDPAIATMQRAIELEPEEPDWREGLMRILDACGQEQRVSEILGDAEVNGR